MRTFNPFLCLFLTLFLTTKAQTPFQMTDILANNQAFQILNSGGFNSFGNSVASAGDVDNDGFDDILIGAPGTNGNQGAVYVIYGGSSPNFIDRDLFPFPLVPTQTGFKISGETAGDRFGWSVSRAGDINKDGYADIIIGAPYRNGNQGAAYVIFGGQKGTRSDIAITSGDYLTQSGKGFTITGEQSGDLLGWSVGGGFDINNDQCDDIIIGAPENSLKKGAAYVIYGRNIGGFANILVASLDPITTGFKVLGNTANDNLGWSVSGAGNVDNDGYDDIIIGAHKRYTDRGFAYIIYGGQNSHIDLTTALVPASTGFAFTSGEGQTYFGVSVSSAGDVNGDGYGDFIIGAQGSASMLGKAYVIYGGLRSSFLPTRTTYTGPLTPGVSGFVISGNAVGDYFGASVSGAGDLNGDGYDDVVIGAPNKDGNRGAICVIYGSKKADAKHVDLQTVPDPTKTGFVVVGPSVGMMFGNSVSITGDFNDDGKTELLIGSSLYNSYQGLVSILSPPKTCAADCDYCAFTTDCIRCSKGYGLKVPAVPPIYCEPCNNSPICTECPTNSLICTACKSGYYLNSASCISCSAHCAKCSRNSGGVLTCTECEAGYALQSGNCVICSLGTYLSAMTCKTCPTHCTQCTSDLECQACQTGYGFAPGSLLCGSCPGGTFLQGQICQTCPQHCTSCLNNAICQTCEPGYGIVSSLCATCPGGTYLDDMICKNCEDGCEVCDATSCFSCIDGFFLESGICTRCPTHCTKCSSDSICSECDPTYGLHSSLCVICPLGTFLESMTCRDCPNGCTICDSATSCQACDSIGYYLPSSTNSVCQECLAICNTCSDGSTCDSCKPGYRLAGSKCILPCSDGTYLSGQNCLKCPEGCSKCTSGSACQACYEDYTLSSNLHVCLYDGDRVEKATNDVADGTSIIGAAVSSGSSLPINFGMVAKILRKIKYLKVQVSPELKRAFFSWKVSSGFLSAPKSWKEKSVSKPLPWVFSQYDLEPVFLINYWKPFMMMMIGSVIFAAFKIIEVTLYKNDQKTLKSSIPRKLNIAASNFVLTQVYSTLDDVIFYGVLDMRSSEFDGAFRVFSLILAVLLIVFGGLVLGFHRYLLLKYQQMRQQETTTKTADPSFLTRLQIFQYKCENIKLFFKDFKDTTLLIQSFLLIHLIRALVSNLIFALLFEYPLVQLSFLMLLNLGMIGYLLMRKPFNDAFGTLSQLFCEILLLIVTLCMLIMAIFDEVKSHPIDTMENLGKGIIILNAILLIGSAVLVAIGVLKGFYTSYKDKKKAPSQGLVKSMPPRLYNNRLPDADKLDYTTDLTQSGPSYISREVGDLRSQDYSNTGGNQTMLNEYYGQNQMQVYDLASDSAGVQDFSTIQNTHNPMLMGDFYGQTNPRNMNYEYELQQPNLNTSFVDQQNSDMMNTSNMNLLPQSSAIRSDMIGRPEIRGKIKMPGGIEKIPNQGENSSLNSIAPSSGQPLSMNTINPSLEVNRSPMKTMGNTGGNLQNKYEEFILKRTRGRVKYREAR